MKQQIEEYWSKREVQTNVIDILLDTCWLESEQRTDGQSSMLKMFKHGLELYYIDLIKGVVYPKDAQKLYTTIDGVDDIRLPELYQVGKDKYLGAISISASAYKSLFPDGRKNPDNIARFTPCAAVLSGVAMSLYLHDINEGDITMIFINHNTQSYRALNFSSGPWISQAKNWAAERLDLRDSKIGFKACSFCNLRGGCSKSSLVTLKDLDQHLEDWIDDIVVSRNKDAEKAVSRHLKDMCKKPSKSHNDGWLHPSAMVMSECHRRFYYGLKGESKIEKIAPGLRNIFNAGHIVHDILQEPFKNDDSVVVEEMAESVQYRMHGHSDLVSPTHIGEIKSAGEWSFNKFAIEPKPSHIAQASIYGSFLKREKINILYFNKNSADLAELEVDVDHSKVEKLTDFAEAVLAFCNVDKLPPKIDDEKECKNCPYEHICK